LALCDFFFGYMKKQLKRRNFAEEELFSVLSELMSDFPLDMILRSLPIGIHYSGVVFC
jgi:mRNA-degrading endonuclease YafQ of YafQ-DinJ toxin-antitoxin module